MTQVTNGTVTYERVVKDADYGVNRKASASFSFNVAEGHDHEAAAKSVLASAVTTVHNFLLAPAAKPAPASTGAAPGPSVAAVSPPAPATTQAAPVASTTKADLEAAAIAAATPSKPRGRPPATVVKLAPEAVADALPGAEKAPTDELDTILGGEKAEAPKPVTDRELSEAIQKKNQSIGKPQEIRALINTYTGGPPKQLRDIEQNKRGDFLKALDALK